MAQKPRKRNEYFAMRKETFRSAGRKFLKSLGCLNRQFTGSFVFKGLTAFSFALFHIRFLDPKSPRSKHRSSSSVRAFVIPRKRYPALAPVWTPVFFLAWQTTRLAQTQSTTARRPRVDPGLSRSRHDSGKFGKCRYVSCIPDYRANSDGRGSLGTRRRFTPRRGLQSPLATMTRARADAKWPRIDDDADGRCDTAW